MDFVVLTSSKKLNLYNKNWQYISNTKVFVSFYILGLIFSMLYFFIENKFYCGNFIRNLLKMTFHHLLDYQM